MKLLTTVSAILSVLLASCARPASDESYSLLGPDGCAGFSLDMTDSLDYSLRLYVYADAAPSDSLPVRIDYLSPDEKVYREDIILTNADAASGSARQMVLCRDLRLGFRPACYGVWKASVYIKDNENITGAGFRLYREKR